jgi:hypothetical protein
MPLGERKERFSGLFRYEGKVDGYGAERLLVGAAKQEQGFGEVYRSGVDGTKALIKFVLLAVGIVSGYVKQGLGDGEWGAQLVGSVGREPPLLGDVRFKASQHGVEGVSQFAEFVVAAWQPDPMEERTGSGGARGVGDASKGGEDPAGKKPSPEETHHQHGRQCDDRGRGEIA